MMLHLLSLIEKGRKAVQNHFVLILRNRGTGDVVAAGLGEYDFSTLQGSRKKKMCAPHNANRSWCCSEHL